MSDWRYLGRTVNRGLLAVPGSACIAAPGGKLALVEDPSTRVPPLDILRRWLCARRPRLAITGPDSCRRGDGCV
jgi:hypothetical protein